jgi:hypothetical protein
MSSAMCYQLVSLLGLDGFESCVFMACAFRVFAGDQIPNGNENQEANFIVSR